MKRLLAALATAGALLTLGTGTAHATAWTSDTICWDLDHGHSVGEVYDDMVREEAPGGDLAATQQWAQMQIRTAVSTCPQHEDQYWAVWPEREGP